MRRLIDRPIRSQDAQDLLEGKVTAAELEARDKAKAKTAPNYIRRPLIRRPLTTTPTTKPLSLAEQRARSRWQRPLPAILAEAMAVNCGLRDRMSRSVKGPDWNHPELYQATFNELWEATKKQIEALEIFCRVEWSD